MTDAPGQTGDADDPLRRAERLRQEGRFAAAVEVLEQALAGFDRSTFAGNDAWLEAQRRIVGCLGSEGAQQYEAAMERFDAVQADFEAHARRTDWPGPDDQARARLRHSEFARERIRCYCALAWYREALAAADYANEVHATLPDGPDRTAQRVHLLSECAAVLLGLDCREDAELLAAEAVDIVRGRFEEERERPENDAAPALRRVGEQAERLLVRLDELEFHRQYADLAELLVTLRGQVATLEPGARHQFELASSEETIGLAYHRIGDGRSRNHLESASSLYLALAETGDAVARAHLARLLKKIAALHDGRSEGEIRRALRESMRHLQVLWTDDAGRYGPAYLDSLQAFCAAIRGRPHLDEERRAACAEAERVIAGFDEQQQSECVALIEQIRRESGASQLRPRASGSARSGTGALQGRRRHARRTLILTSGVVLVLLVGLFLALVLYQEPDVRCTELQLDAMGEEVCARWENRSGVSRTPLEPDD